jgi:hypothetical protein
MNGDFVSAALAVALLACWLAMWRLVVENKRLKIEVADAEVVCRQLAERAMERADSLQKARDQLVEISRLIMVPVLRDVSKG